MSNHVIKYEYEDGNKISPPILWCGGTSTAMEFTFRDAQHVALAVGGGIQPCKDCIRAIIKQLQEEL